VEAVDLCSDRSQAAGSTQFMHEAEVLVEKVGIDPQGEFTQPSRVRIHAALDDFLFIFRRRTSERLAKSVLERLWQGTNVLAGFCVIHAFPDSANF
jgi:hypothetical protein